MNYEIAPLRVRRLPTADYIARFRDVARFENLCRACPGYGRRWGCPPFADDPQPDLSRWGNVEIWLLRLDIIDPGDASVDDLYGMLQRERGPWERLLLEAEEQRGGRAALFTGMCPHCGDAPCARVSGRPCRHPGLVRPSQEALGFDLGKTAEELFGLPLKWAADGQLPDYMTLIGGLFY